MTAHDSSLLSRELRDGGAVCAERERVDCVARRLRGDGAEPRIAVVICTRDRPESLRLTLKSVWRQKRLPDELIVIDDGCLPEAVREEAIRVCRRTGIVWQYCRKGLPGLTRSRNVAADLALSEVLLYLDDDATCEPGCIEEIARLMRDRRVSGVTAAVREPRFESRTARLYQLGYRLAGWWSVYPRGVPKGERPAVLARQDVAERARWLSGAAMALRRDVVRRHRFDERLTAYALGEDREFGYRLMPEHWLLLGKRVRVTHRREESQRTDSRRLGYMTTLNYLYILRKTCRLRAGDWLVVCWSFAVLAAMHLAWACVGDRAAHLGELRGMLAGVLATFGEAVREAVFGRSEASADVPVGASLREPVETSVCRSGGGPVVKKRVLFVSTRLDPGGAELMMMALAQRLPEHGVAPYVMGLKSGGALIERCRELGIPVFDGLLKHKLDVFVVRRLRRFIVEHGIDVVAVAHSGGDRMFWSTLAAGSLGVPVVVWSHWFPTEEDPHIERSNRLLYRWVDAFVALGSAHREALVRHAQVPSGRIQIIPNAIDVAAFAEGEARLQLRAETRASLGLADHHVAIGIVANLRRVKRHDVFIEAAQRVLRDHPDTRFFIIGEGPDGEAVRSVAAGAGLGDEALRFLGHRTDLPAILAALDVSCLCSEIECFSVGMLEAAASGCAFIGPAAGAMGEFLEHDVTGLAIQPADVGGLTDAMERLVEDPALRQRLAAAARARVVKDYALADHAEAFAALYHRLAKAGRPASLREVNVTA